MQNIPVKRVSLFLGHYGSGKTNIAVNYSIFLEKSGYKAAIYDLDIVNPYFRTLDGKGMLTDAGVRLVASTYANSNVEVPAIPADNYAIVDKKDEHAVVDVGGDDRGALALGRYAEDIMKENDYEAFLVINKYRFLTRDPKEVLECLKEIEDAAKIKITSLVNNSNLGKETTAQTVLDSIGYAKECSYLTGLPIAFTAVKKDLSEELNKKISPILPIDMIKYGDWE